MPSAEHRIPDLACSGLSISDGAPRSMTEFVEPGNDEKTVALERDFENRAFISDFSQSVQQLASFVSNFGTLHFKLTCLTALASSLLFIQGLYSYADSRDLTS